jgi:DNA polymerase-3 subunit alpha
MVISIIFDTETTGLPRDKNMPAVLLKDNWPDLVSLSWRTYKDGTLAKAHSYLIKPDGWTIPEEATKIHGISQAKAETGFPLEEVIYLFSKDLRKATNCSAHNLAFDKQVILNALRWRLGERTIKWSPLADICTGLLSTPEVKLFFSGRTYGAYKMPSLKELYMDTFQKEDPPGAHDSSRDVQVLEEIVLKRWPSLLL